MSNRTSRPWAVLAFALMTWVCPWAVATTYYVSPTGSDTNNGTQAAPWRTVAHAASSVGADSGHAIAIAAGTYVESAQIVLRSGVNLQGAGPNSTVIRPAANLYNLSGAVYDRHRALIQCKGGNGNQTLTGFGMMRCV